MPSLFSRLKNRKSLSSASEVSLPSSSNPPHAARKSLDTSTHRSGAGAGSGATVAPAASTPHLPSTSASWHLARDQVEQPTPQSTLDRARDGTGHSAPFADEVDRPELPTTTSNVHNTAPDPRSMTWKPEPAHGSESRARAMIPEAAEPSDSDFSGGRNHALPPLPHVETTDRTMLQDITSSRPDLIGSSSRPTVEAGEGRHEPFHHVDSVLAEQQHQSPAGVTGPVDESGVTRSSIDVPSRNTSLKPDLQPSPALSSLRHPDAIKLYNMRSGQPSSSTYQTSGGEGETQSASAGAGAATGTGTGTGTQVTIDEQRGPDLSGSRTVFPSEPSSSRQLSSRPAGSAVAEGTSLPNVENLSLSDSQIGVRTLDEQRRELVDSVVAGARERKIDLSEEARDVFRQAGMLESAEQKGDVELRTKVLPPVVHETIIPKEHIEYTTVIERHIHKHHVFPLIQPISDPDPIKLEPRHRIFSPIDGQWHEVIGDAAAIEILGEEAFYRGKKEVREVRAPAGDLDKVAEQRQRSSATGAQEGGGERFGSRVIEREGVQGGEMSAWKELSGHGPGGAGGREEVGDVIDGLEGGLGEKVIGVAI